MKNRSHVLDRRQQMLLEYGSAVLNARGYVGGRSTGYQFENVISSPIEEMMLMALTWPHDGEGRDEVHGPFISPGEYSVSIKDRDIALSVGLHLDLAIGRDDKWYLFAQQAVGPYTVDFLVWSFLGCVVVECDGHDFHSRTKEQARHDRKRDRFMQSRDLRVLRFTGSEIWKDARACASEVFRSMDQFYFRHPWRDGDHE